MKFSFDQAWADGVAMGRTHFGLILAIVGVFLILPQFAQLLFFPIPPIAEFNEEAIAALNAYITDNALIFLLFNVPVLLGQSAILSMLLHDSRPTVGQSLALSVPLLLTLIILGFLVNLAIILGLILFIVPGVYLIGRLFVTMPIVVAEGTLNPFTAIARSFTLTRGNGWAIAGIAILIGVVGYIVAGAIGSVIGIILTVILPAVVATTLIALVQSTLAAVTLLALVLLSAAVYRQCVDASSKGM